MIDIIIPSPGESITKVEIGTWLVKDSEFVEKDQELVEIESDKASMIISAEESGKIKILADEGEIVEVGSVIANIDNSDNKVKSTTNKININNSEKILDKAKNEQKKYPNFKLTPLAKSIIEKDGLNIDEILNKIDGLSNNIKALSLKNLPAKREPDEQKETRRKMSMLRKKLSQKLVAVKNETAMLTTFNEVDMSSLMDLKQKFSKKFLDKHNVKLGFMSFFTKAASIALSEFPNINSMIDAEDIVSYSYANIGIAVQTPKGLMVPVIKNSDKMSISEIEIYISQMAKKARDGKISINDLIDGTFTITNGGVFGSLLSTPIINPPQSAILGMHNIVERPIVDKGNIVARPMMYLALSYDHRIIDGKDSVGFLKRIKELIENPILLMNERKTIESDLLNLT
ncbi:MAG: 2-oxoglutarate dehydrogenase complex dihydrolipoyllysine-residue succinyltransferase [Marinifilaceae bacterium]|jgi:2-oxoglutarate dehydrogenase E2 component (dihydrolipoamide succinyltransferase)|nr:2-oxoglutarate dehydrogenase complex dihydrolipoyllysine-residue succinyltransferase [Marinifilaceae bacterium]